MIKFANAQELADHFGFEPKTSADYRRLDYAWHLYLIQYKGQGCMGCIAEVLRAGSTSRKKQVSGVGKPDNRIRWIDESGRKTSRVAESKTNGGRIMTVATAEHDAEQMQGTFVLYSMDVCNKNTGYKRRVTVTKVFPKAVFLAHLFEHGQVKEMRHKGEVDGYGIQVTSLELYEWVSSWPVEYDRNRYYTATDFEGLI